MKYCEHCGLSLADKANFCRRCGEAANYSAEAATAPLTNMAYPPQSTEYNADYKEEPNARTEQEYAPPAPQKPNTQGGCYQGLNKEQVAENKKPFEPNRIVFSVLAIFLGGLGVHRFYTKSYASGVFFLILCWTFIPAIIGVIEGIISICNTDEQFCERRYAAHH